MNVFTNDRGSEGESMRPIRREGLINLELVHIGEPLGNVLKEVLRRAELRQRLEAERGGPISDEKFVKIAKATGLQI